MTTVVLQISEVLAAMDPAQSEYRVDLLTSQYDRAKEELAALLRSASAAPGADGAGGGVTVDTEPWFNMEAAWAQVRQALRATGPDAAPSLASRAARPQGHGKRQAQRALRCYVLKRRGGARGQSCHGVCEHTLRAAAAAAGAGVPGALVGHLAAGARAAPAAAQPLHRHGLHRAPAARAGTGGDHGRRRRAGAGALRSGGGGGG